MITKASFRLNEEEKVEAIKRIIETSFPGSDFYIMLVASSVIASVGLMLDNASIIIGSMLVAPFLSPILSLGLGIAMSDFQVIQRSLWIVLKSIAVAVLTAMVMVQFISMSDGYTSEILSRTSANLPYLYVAIAAGVAASLAIARKALREFIVGVAISVAILPPLATIGIGIGSLDWGLVVGSLQLFIINLIGVVFSSLTVFALMGFYPERKRAEAEIKKEEVKLKKESGAAQ